MAEDIIDPIYFENGETAGIIADLSHKATKATELKDGAIYAVINPEGGVDLLETPGYTDKHSDDRADHPFRVTRSVTLLDVPSFMDYLARNTQSDPELVGEDYLHGDGALELWADIDGRKITAILDGGDGWRGHKATLELRTSREWKEWLAIDGKLLPQVDFAEFIDSHLSTIAEPAGALLLDICQTLEATVNASFKQETVLSTGQRTFKWSETIDAKAGQGGKLTIPGDLTLVLRPFQGAAGVPITARFRIRPADTGLRLGVKLVEPDVVLEQAFDLVVRQVQEQAPVHVNHGRP